jgi:uncharacterized protein YecE (DUF72 family)
MLYQLPPRWRPNHERLATFLSALPDNHPQVIEIRDRRWYGPRLSMMLADVGVSLCLHDMPGSAPLPIRVGPLVYVRFHGAGERYGGSYSPQRLNAWARRISIWSAQGWPVWVYFNNDIGGHAVRDAERLRTYVERAAG